MNIYIEKGSFFQTAGNIKKCYKQYRNKEEIHFHLIVPKKLSMLETFFYFGGKKIRDVELVIHYKALKNMLVKLLYRKSGTLSVVLLVDKKLTEKEWKKIQKLSGMIRIIDTTDSNYENYYSQNRYVLCNTDKRNMFEEADGFQIACGGNGIYQCKHTSCLGRNIYVSMDGSVSFCPIYEEKTKMGTVDQLNTIFESEVFIEALKKMIAKRNECKQSCSYFAGCKGGCLFEDACEAFCQKQEEYQKEVAEILETKRELDGLPFSKEVSILHMMLKVKR